MNVCIFLILLFNPVLIPAFVCLYIVWLCLPSGEESAQEGKQEKVIAGEVGPCYHYWYVKHKH